MCIRLAEIMSDVYLAVGRPPSTWLERSELWYATKTISAKYIESIQQSDQNQIIEFEEFNFNNEFEYDLAAIVGKGVPAWVERKLGDYWQPLRVVNLHNLERFRNDGVEAVSFYGDKYGSFKVKTTFQTTDDHRLWYDPEEAFDLKEDSDSVLPRNFNKMLVLETGAFILPMMLNNAVRNSREEISNQQILAWNKLEVSFNNQLEDWKVKWNTWLKRSRGAQSSGMRRRLFKRRLY